MSGSRLEKVCLACAKDFWCYASNPHKYCSKICCYKDRTGSKNPAYKGGTVLDKNGYIRVRGKAKRRGMYQHQVVMASILGRELKPGEEVHHINGIKTDNRSENLFLVDKRNHSRKHFQLFVEVQRIKRENEILKKELSEIQTQFIL